MGLINQTAEEYYANNKGSYRYISLKDIVNNFMVMYVGENKLIHSARRSEVIIHAKRAIQEFAYDASGVEKIEELELNNAYNIPMPQDFVDVAALHWVDYSGIIRPIYEGRITKRPSSSPLQDSDGDLIYDEDGSTIQGEPITNDRFEKFSEEDATKGNDNEYLYNRYLYSGYSLDRGTRYGLDPETTQSNGFYFIDRSNGVISFSSNVHSKIVILSYISDGLGTDEEMKVHKFLEQSMYLRIAYEILNASVNVQEYIVRRYRKSSSAALANAKIRMLNLRNLEMIQTMRGKSQNTNN